MSRGLNSSIPGFVRWSYTGTHTHTRLQHVRHITQSSEFKTHAPTQTHRLGVDSPLGKICHGFAVPEDGVEGFSSCLRSMSLSH